MDTSSTETTVETVTVEILGNHLRVRVPAASTEDVMSAAGLLRERINQVRDPTDTPERAVMRAALGLAFEAIVANRDATALLEGLIMRLDACLQA